MILFTPDKVSIWYMVVMAMIILTLVKMMTQYLEIVGMMKFMLGAATTQYMLGMGMTLFTLAMEMILFSQAMEMILYMQNPETTS